jgi:hypothetical protein
MRTRGICAVESAYRPYSPMTAFDCLPRLPAADFAMYLSGEVELRYSGRDVFEQSVLLAVKDRDAFLRELESRINAATGASLQVARAQR